MRASNIWEIKHKDFMKLIQPSFACIDEAEDMDAIIARTHIIVITDHGIYWRLAHPQHRTVPFVQWPENEPHDLLIPSQKDIFRSYKKDPFKHTPPPSFHADMVWSQEVLQRLLRGESIPRTITIRPGRSLFGDIEPQRELRPELIGESETAVRVKKEKVSNVFQTLKRTGPVLIDLDSPVQKRIRAACTSPTATSASAAAPASSSAEPSRSTQAAYPPQNPDFLQACDEEHELAEVREPDSLELQLEHLIDQEKPEDIHNGGAGDDMDIAEESDVAAGHHLLGGLFAGQVVRDVCGLQVLRWFGFPVEFEMDGPFSVLQLNSMIRKFQVQFVPVKSKSVFKDGMYLCHKQNHFTGVRSLEGYVRRFDNETEYVCNVSYLQTLADDSSTTLFRLVPREEKFVHRLCDLSGGAGQVFSRSRPAAREQRKVLMCPCQTCVIPGCSGSLIEKTDKQLEAICYTLSGPVEVIHQSKQCTARNCRATYGYNFRWEEGKKINVLSIKDFADGMLFVNAKKGFSLQYLQYHEELVFRGHLSTRAIEHAYNEVFGDEEDQVVTAFRKLHQTAMFYHLALQEFEVLGLHMTLVLDDEVTDKALDIYSAYCHATLFPPSSRSKVKCLVGDGHLALRARCEDGPCKRAGRPRKNTQPIGKHSNGWFMCCDPTSGRIVSLMVMHEPECNEYVTKSLESILWLYPKCTCFVYDRACSFVKSARTNEAFEQIQDYIVDWFHAYGHAKDCACNPRTLTQSKQLSLSYVGVSSLGNIQLKSGHRKRLGRIIQGVNTSICEQVFAWFRHFSTNFNELRGNRHRFIILYMAKRHNQAIENNTAVYLRPIAHPASVRSTPYGCSKKQVKKSKTNVKKVISRKTSKGKYNRGIMKRVSMKK